MSSKPEDAADTSAQELRAKTRKIQEVLDGFGLNLSVREFSQSTRSAAEAAAAIGCRVEQIAKSLVFRGEQSGKPVLAIVSGRNRVDETALAARVGEPIVKADAGFVRERLGFAIGGVPPVGHLEPVECHLDETLFEFDTIWAAAGTPFSVFPLTPEQLRQLTGTIPGRFCKEMKR